MKFLLSCFLTSNRHCRRSRSIAYNLQLSLLQKPSLSWKQESVRLGGLSCQTKNKNIVISRITAAQSSSSHDACVNGAPTLPKPIHRKSREDHPPRDEHIVGSTVGRSNDSCSDHDCLRFLSLCYKTKDRKAKSW